MTRRTPLFAFLFFVFASAGCGTEDGPTACDQASDKVMECFGQALDECTPEMAEQINGSDCEGLASTASMDSKADGSIFCPGWLWWLCGDDLSVDCPGAGTSAKYATYDSAKRMDYHWAWGECTQYGQSDVPPLKGKFWDVLLNSASGLITSGLRLGRAFTNTTDELDRGRVKLLHPYGTVAKVALLRSTPDAECAADYTGVFAEDEVSGLARFGWGADPKAAGFVPGFGLKVFIEGDDSVNLHVIHSLSGDPEKPNFFSQTLGNILPMPGGVVGGVVRLFKLVVDNPLHLRLEHFARKGTDGSSVAAADLAAPYGIRFDPTTAAADLYDQDADFRDALGAYPKGSHLYDVYMQAEQDGCWGLWGTLETRSGFVASEWGDRKLYFKHSTEEQGL